MNATDIIIQQQVTAFLLELSRAPRHPTVGYLGTWVPDRLIVLASGLGADGQRYINDPGEMADGHPDLVLHEWLKIVAAAPAEQPSFQPSRGGLDLSTLVRLLGTFSPAGAGGAGLLQLLRGLPSSR